jgi:GxxExxY protein
MIDPNYRHSDVTDRIIAAFYKVYNALGWGFLEKVYQNSMAIELARTGLTAVAQAQLKVAYTGIEVGEYYADFLVENSVIVELKSVEQLASEHHAQLLNYLRATDIEVGLLLNFGPKPEIKRKVCETARHPSNSSSSSSAPKSASSAGHSSRTN